MIGDALGGPTAVRRPVGFPFAGNSDECGIWLAGIECVRIRGVNRCDGG